MTELKVGDEEFTKIDLLVGDVVTLEHWEDKYFKILSIFEDLDNQKRYVIQDLSHSEGRHWPIIVERKNIESLTKN